MFRYMGVMLRYMGAMLRYMGVLYEYFIIFITSIFNICLLYRHCIMLITRFYKFYYYYLFVFCSAVGILCSPLFSPLFSLIRQKCDTSFCQTFWTYFVIIGYILCCSFFFVVGSITAYIFYSRPRNGYYSSRI